MEKNNSSEKVNDEIIEKTNSSEKVNGEIIKNTNSSKDKMNKKPKKKIEWFKILLTILLVILISTIAYGIISIKASIGVTQEQKWEYKTVNITPSANNSRTGTGASEYNAITPSETQLNTLGGEGWELVSSYLEMETAYPNFGDEKYVTGIQPNIRPQSVVLLFKRPVNVK